MKLKTVHPPTSHTFREPPSQPKVQTPVRGVSTSLSYPQQLQKNVSTPAFPVESNRSNSLMPQKSSSQKSCPPTLPSRGMTQRTVPLLPGNVINQRRPSVPPFVEQEYLMPEEVLEKVEVNL